MKPNPIVHALVALATGSAGPALAADIVFTPPSSGGVAITNAAGNVIRLRVAEDGAFTLPGLASVPLPAIGLCAEVASGRVGTCSVGVFTSLTAGTGLTGGTITTSGTVALAPGFQLPQACTNGQIPASNGAGSWSCASPAAASGGTVTSVAAGAGLIGGPITTSGTINLAATQLLPTLACSVNQIPKWSGSAWACAADNNSAIGVSAVTATAPLSSSGGATPNISLGTVTVASGGTGQATLAANGVVYGQGTNAVGTAIGVAGQVLAGSAGAPLFTASPSLGGNLQLVASSASAGNILKGGAAFIHDFGTQNSFVGKFAGNFTMTGYANTAIGYATLANNAAGFYNTASGYAALRFNTDGGYNTASGGEALHANTTGSYNTADGYQALSSNTTGIFNAASGAGALVFNTTGSSNTAHGASALTGNQTGSFNTGVGKDALLNSDASDNNTAVGYRALFSSLTGSNNAAIGAAAMAGLTTGFENAALGMSALLANTVGAGNTGVGYKALAANTTSYNSTAVGAQALFNSDAAGNIALGAFAGYNLTTGGGNIAIGNVAAAAESDTIRIGGGQSRAFMAGIRGITTGVNNAIAVFIDSNGQLGTASSSRRVKDDIADMGQASEALMQLRPVTFRYKSHVASGQASRQYGLIAEEVAEVAPELVAHAADGSFETVNYQFLAPMLVNEIQKQRKTIETLQAELAAIRAAIGLR